MLNFIFNKRNETLKYSGKKFKNYTENPIGVLPVVWRNKYIHMFFV